MITGEDTVVEQLGREQGEKIYFGFTVTFWQCHLSTEPNTGGNAFSGTVSSPSPLHSIGLQWFWQKSIDDCSKWSSYSLHVQPTKHQPLLWINKYTPVYKPGRSWRRSCCGPAGEKGHTSLLIFVQIQHHTRKDRKRKLIWWKLNLIHHLPFHWKNRFAFFPTQFPNSAPQPEC